MNGVSLDNGCFDWKGNCNKLNFPTQHRAGSGWMQVRLPGNARQKELSLCCCCCFFGGGGTQCFGKHIFYYQTNAD